MLTKPIALTITTLSCALLLAACGESNRPVTGDGAVVQTRFPGQVTAGGGTSGEVLARSAATQETPAPSGTPGIPQGSGGTTGGAAMGGTSGVPDASTPATPSDDAKPQTPAATPAQHKP